MVLQKPNKSSTVFPVQARHSAQEGVSRHHAGPVFYGKIQTWEWIMSDKKEVGLNEVDIQAVIAAWIIANNGCGSSNGVDCYGEKGIFKGTVCQFYRHTGCIASGDAKVGEAKAWLAKYHQQKAEAAEAEKRKAEAAKNREQEAKKTCGDCRHIYDADSSVEIGLSTTLCHKKSIRVPIEFTGCHDFEPMATGKMTLQSQNSASERAGDDIIYNGILIGSPSQEDKLRHMVWLLEIKNSHRLNDIERLKTEAAKRTAEDAEHDIESEPSDSVPFRAAFFDVLKENRTLRNRLNKTAAEYSDLATGALATKSNLNRHEEMVFQLKKLNARLRYRIHVYKENLKSAKELCESGKCDAKKDRADLAARCERLTEQRNRLSNSLIEVTRRVKEVERENAALLRLDNQCRLAFSMTSKSV